jgi:hypothetical protein
VGASQAGSVCAQQWQLRSDGQAVFSQSLRWAASALGSTGCWRAVLTLLLLLL